MASTTLGKRRRHDDHTATSSLSAGPSPKKRALRSCSNGENTPPSFDEHARYDATYGNVSQLAELNNPFVVSCNASTQRPIAVGRTARDSEFVSAPTKINRHFKTVKTTTREQVEKVQLVTPKTSRYRDALPKRVPITPRHRAIDGGNPQTPRTPLTPSNAPTIYNSARQLFVRSADPGRLVGRDDERSKIHTFIEAGIASKSGRCMYISGPPGTGKSALVSEVCGAVRATEDVHVSYVNCMSVKCSGNIYGKLLGDLAGVDKEDSDSQGLATLKLLFLPKKPTANQTYVVVLDEIDHLLTLDLEILYTLFEWSLSRSSRLVLIGIANALDLTDRFLPRLKARNLKPELLPFLPYTVTQIGSVVTSKLKSLISLGTVAPDYVPYVHPAAIQFCSKKVAAQTGDLRKAFDIIRRAIDLVENETKQKHKEDLRLQSLQDSPSKSPLGENKNLSSPCSPVRSIKKPRPTLMDSLARLTPENAPRATIAHMARVTASAFNHGTVQRLQSLNLQQKAALCSLVALEKKTVQMKRDLFATPSKSATAAPTIRRVYEMYSGLCRRENALHPLTSTEFTDVIGSLETLTLIQGGDGKSVRMGLARLTPSKRVLRAEDKRIVSCVSEQEVVGCLDGPGGGILKGLLHGEE